MGNLKTIHAAAQRARSVNFDDIIRQSIAETKDYIIQFNRENLLKGLKVDGSKIGTYATIPYAAKKFAQNSQAGFGFVDLYLTGDFAKGIQVKLNSKSFTTFSIDSKADKLELEYSKDIYGLPFNRKAEYAEILGQAITRNTKSAIFGI